MSTAVQLRAFIRAAPRPLRKSSAIVATGLLSWLVFAPTAHAQSPLVPSISFDGFGTMGVAHSTQDQADFVESGMRKEGAGHSTRFDANLDTRIAGQLTAQAGSRITGVLQVVVEQGISGDYEPSVEWANLTFALTPDLSVRGGRIVMPLFLVSDARKVSYANPWIRPPVELYGMVPIYAWDGVDASYRQRLGEWTGSLNAALGRTSTELAGGHVDADPFWNVNATVQRGVVTGRAAVAAGDVTVEQFAPLFDGFRSFGPEGEAIAARFDVENRPVRFATAGMELDPGRWFTMAEVGWLQTESVMGDRLGGYITGGVRTGPVTPFVTLSRIGSLSESSTQGLTLTGLPEQYAQAGAALNAALNEILRSPPLQQNLALGGRWDVAAGIALKAQVEFIDLLENSNGTFTNVQPTFEPGGSSQLFSVAAAFVF